LNNRSAEQFIPCFHIGKIQIAEHIRKKGKHSVSDTMPEEQDAVRIAADKS